MNAVHEGGEWDGMRWGGGARGTLAVAFGGSAGHWHSGVAELVARCAAGVGREQLISQIL